MNTVNGSVQTTSPRSLENVQLNIPPKSLHSSPPVPPRSPLRPRTKSVSIHNMQNSTFIVSSETIQLIDAHPPTLNPDQSDKKLSSSSLPEPPSPLSAFDLDDAGTSSSSSLSNILTSTPLMSKRNHALLELLSSERAYASDLALIRDMHIPLALGQPSSLALNSSPSSDSSSRTMSTTSDSSNSSAAIPAMSREDTRIIFSNISDLAVFADFFTGRLEDALGSVLEGGNGEDRVGELFLEMIPTMESLYQHYITRHPTALEHLSNLPPSPSLDAYLQHTRTLASSLSHAWDLSSLLIKPVQRLLKYSLLLTAIIDGTADDHPDKPNLRIAKEKMDEVARGVNEGRRRREVVKGVLTGGKRDGNNAGPKKKGLNIGVATSVSLGKMKGMRNVVKVEGSDDNHEKEQIEKMEAELKACEVFIRKFAKDVVAWGKTMKELMRCLSVWTVSFGRVIGISEDQISEAFNAFKTVVDQQLVPLCDDLEVVIKGRLLTQLALLVDTMLPPSRLLEAMHTLEPLHYGLLNLNVSKSRPPPALLEASQSYIALRGQLFVELPEYLKLLHKGVVAAIMQLSVWQAQFWGDVRARWGELWEALRVDGEFNVGSAPETVRIWWERFSVVDEGLEELEIIRKLDKPYASSSVSRPISRSERPIHTVSSSKQYPRSKNASSRTIDGLPLLEPVIIGPPDSDHAMKRSPDMETHDAPRRRSGGWRASEPSKHVKRDSVQRVDDYDFIEASPIPSPTIGSYIFTNYNTDIKAAVPMVRNSSGKPSQEPLPSTSLPSPKSFSRESARKHSIRRKMTDTFDNIRPASPSAQSTRRSPSLPAVSRKKLSAQDDRSPSPKMPGAFSSQPNTPKRPAFAYVTPIMYECEVVSSFNVGRDVTYEGIPFHRLRAGARLGILEEAGHPCTHPNLPIHVDDGEDCLLMARNIEGVVGWAFASFLMPID